jgi:CheY-like chemotaxis protein
VILVVDDDPSMRASTQRLLAARGYTAIEATSPATAQILDAVEAALLP